MDAIVGNDGIEIQLGEFLATTEQPHRPTCKIQKIGPEQSSFLPRSPLVTLECLDGNELKLPVSAFPTSNWVKCRKPKDLTKKHLQVAQKIAHIDETLIFHAIQKATEADWHLVSSTCNQYQEKTLQFNQLPNIQKLNYIEHMEYHIALVKYAYANIPINQARTEAANEMQYLPVNHKPPA